MPEPFMFATGIENSYPTIQWQGKTVRRDEMQECGHYQRWREDFGLVKNLGLQYLRYGPPLYKTYLGAEKYDWSFADETYKALKEMQLNPITDLCHFGLPDWMGGFDNPDWPELFAKYARAFAQRFAKYARAFAQRFPWVRLYTPVNEIFVAATFSGLLGWWNERQSSDKGFVTALHHLCKANVLAMRAILDVQPDATFIQSESSEYFHMEEPSQMDRAHFYNERRFLSLDLTYGHTIDVVMYRYLMDNGMTPEQFDWFHTHHVKRRCIMGNDYYATNEHCVCQDGSVVPSGEIFGYYVITRQYYARYRLPVMHTETNKKDAEQATGWLRKEWANVCRLKQDGVPIVGFTWYSLTDQIDWDTALREKNNRVNECGLHNLDRKIRPVGEAYGKLVSQWRDVLSTENENLGTAF